MKKRNKYTQTKITHLKNRILLLEKELTQKNKLLSSVIEEKDSFKECYYLMESCAKDNLNALKDERDIREYLINSFKTTKKELEDQITLLKEQK